MPDSPRTAARQAAEADDFERSFRIAIARARFPLAPDDLTLIQFADKIDYSLECWNWIGGCKTTGYGVIGNRRKPREAHRLSYAWARGPIPDGLVIDHLCRNRRCVNPIHLDVVTDRVNILRGVGLSAMNARKTHCKRGHELNRDNTYVTPDGARHCRACQAARARARWRRLHPLEPGAAKREGEA